MQRFAVIGLRGAELGDLRGQTIAEFGRIGQPGVDSTQPFRELVELRARIWLAGNGITHRRGEGVDALDDRVDRRQWFGQRPLQRRDLGGHTVDAPGQLRLFGPHLGHEVEEVTEPRVLRVPFHEAALERLQLGAQHPQCVAGCSAVGLAGCVEVGTQAGEIASDARDRFGH